MNRRSPISWLAPAIFSALLAVPGLSQAQDDLDVTMRMVADDQELDDSLVQQLELPESAEEERFGTLPMNSDEFAEETRESMLDLEETLTEQSLETGDDLGIELPGGLIGEEPDLELELPGSDDTNLDLDTDLDLLENDSLNVDDTELQ